MECHQFVDEDQTLARIINKQVESKTNNYNTRDKLFILWFSLLPRLAYVHIVQEAT
jgi:hypothetical protein